MSFLRIVSLFITLQAGISSQRTLDYMTKQQSKDCLQLPPPVLNNILGSAFNSRYMSIDKPPVMEEESINGETDAKRGANSGFYPSFSVEKDHTARIVNTPAWAVDHVKDTVNPALTISRSKRETFDSLLQVVTKESRSANSFRRGRADGSTRLWDCEAKIRWIDLGTEYYPRYLRSVECGKSRCWYGHYQCTPRAFTVKILRKRTGQCVPADQLQRIGVEGLPGELSELWVWEERAVTFCCDCSPRF